MGNAIVDVVLGLVLTYLVLSLLVMKVQEILDGNLLKGRVSNLHEMLLEAVGRSQDLRDKVLKNPLIFALYKGKDANDHMLWRSSGPSSIPPDLFARALLMELNGGRHPSEEFPKPSAFLAARTLGKDVADAPRVWGALNGLLPGNEGDWKAFESAIATWFTDIGDRSDGWFQRRAQGGRSGARAAGPPCSTSTASISPRRCRATTRCARAWRTSRRPSMPSSGRRQARPPPRPRPQRIPPSRPWPGSRKRCAG